MQLTVNLNELFELPHETCDGAIGEVRGFNVDYTVVKLDLFFNREPLPDAPKHKWMLVNGHGYRELLNACTKVKYTLQFWITGMRYQGIDCTYFVEDQNYFLLRFTDEKH